MPVWWLSFVSDDDILLGVVIIKAATFGQALLECTLLSANPGGQVMGWDVGLLGPLFQIPAEYRNRLLSREEISAHPKIFGVCRTIREFEEIEAAEGMEGIERLERGDA